ncbi:hypothetical protein HN51_036518 [Arachis hypogaea]
MLFDSRERIEGILRSLLKQIKKLWFMEALLMKETVGTTSSTTPNHGFKSY